MKDNLISREAAIEALEFERDSLETPGRINGVEDAIEVIQHLSSVAAVPLDKLCEWLERYAMMNCDGCREGFGSCEDEENQEVSVCNSRERWKAMLTKWMEEQDAKEEKNH